MFYLVLAQPWALTDNSGRRAAAKESDMAMATYPLTHEDSNGTAQALACHNELIVRKVSADMVSLGDELVVVSLTRPSKAVMVTVIGAWVPGVPEGGTGTEVYFTTNTGLVLDPSHGGFADGCDCCYRVVLHATRENILLAREWLASDDSEVAEFCSRELSKLLQ